MTPADLDAMARTVYGEARGENYDSMKAVAHVIVNRWEKKHRKEHTLAGVATEPYQFSCWNINDPNRHKLENVTLNDRKFTLSMRAALEAYDDSLKGIDPTLGATHYHTHAISPNWAYGKTPSYIVGSHKYYNNVK